MGAGMAVRAIVIGCAMACIVWMCLGALLNRGSVPASQLVTQILACTVLLYVIVRASVEMDRIRMSRIKSRLKRRHDD